MARKKILLVDDSTTILMMEKMTLNTGDYDLVTAKNGLEAIDKALAERPDLILMDVNMPKMDGFEACRNIRARAAEVGAVPIIMVTTRGESTNIELGYESGCNDYVTKPIDSVELLSKIKDHLGE
jgi:DNA-binding response OmpR family regulator